MCGGGAGPTGVMKTRGGDRGARLTVAEGVGLREVSVEETTGECHDIGGGGFGGHESYLPKCEEEDMESPHSEGRPKPRRSSSRIRFLIRLD